MDPYRLSAQDTEVEATLRLIQHAFAYMEGRIDPPSSMKALTPDSIKSQAKNGEVWCIGRPPLACVFLTPKPGRLYLGKLAVDENMRGKGLARRLVDLAKERAVATNKKIIELETRIELVENHATFAHLGFVVTGETAHPGYDRPTSLTMQLNLDG